MSIFSKVGELFGVLPKGVQKVSTETTDSTNITTVTSNESSVISNNEGNEKSESLKRETNQPNAESIQSAVNESQMMTDIKNLAVNTDAAAKYGNLSPEDKVIALEKAVNEQGIYLKSIKDAMKVLNRRNTLAVIELQMLVRDAELKHPDLREIIDPVMVKVSAILDFKKPYEV